MKRTQIYLPEEIWRKLKSTSAKVHASASDLIRQALIKVYRAPKSKEEAKRALDETFGMWKGRKEIKGGVQYVRKIRRGWDQRLKRIPVNG